MAKSMTFELTNNMAHKVEDGQYYDISLLYNEIKSLIKNNIIQPGLKYNYKPKDEYIYNFKSNNDSALYSSHGIDYVKIIVKNQNQKTDEINNLLNNQNEIVTYKTSQDLFEIGLVKGSLVNGFSLATYAVEKNTKDLVKAKEEKKKTYHKKDLSKFLIF